MSCGKCLWENVKDKLETGTKRSTTELQYVAVQLAVVLLWDVEVQQCVVGLYRWGAERRPVVRRLNSLDSRASHWGLWRHVMQKHTQKSTKRQLSVQKLTDRWKSVWCHFITFYPANKMNSKAVELNITSHHKNPCVHNLRNLQQSVFKILIRVCALSAVMDS